MRFHIASPRRSFARFLVSYIVLLLIGVTAETIVFALLIRSEKEAIVLSNLEVLETSVIRLEERLRSLEDIVVIISDHRVYPNIASLMRRPESPTPGEYFDYIHAVNTLPNYKLTNGLISDYYVHLRNSRFVVSPGVGSGRARTFYEAHLAYPGLDFDDWVDELYRQFHVRTYWPAEDLGAVLGTARYVTLLKSIPIDSFVGYAGTVIFLIEERQLLAYLDIVAGFATGGEAIILDGEGRRIASSARVDDAGLWRSLERGVRHSEVPIDGGTVSVVSVLSDYTGWLYAVAVPTGVFWRGLDRVRNLLIAVLGVTLAPGLALAIGFSRRYSRALRRIAAKLRGSGDDGGAEEDEYRFIESSVGKLVSKSSELTDRLREQRPLLRSGFLDRLFSGGYVSANETDSYLRFVDLDLKASSYVVAVLRVEGYRGEISADIINELAMTSAVTLDVLKANLPSRAYCHTIEPGAVAVLYPSHDLGAKPAYDAFRGILRSIVLRLRREYDVRVACGLGNACHDLMEVSTSYHQAQRCLGHGDGGDEPVVAFAELSQLHEIFSYPVQDEIRLMNVVRSGASNEVTALLKKIRDQNRDAQGNPSIESNQRLMEGLRNTLARLEPDIASTSQSAALVLGTCLAALDHSDDFDGFLAKATSGLLDVCEEINRGKRSHNDLLREEIVRFVDSHYHDPQMNLAMVASEFRLAEKYLSKFFKEQTGENFSSHIETVRLERARALLSNGEQTIAVVSELVGYSTTNTFHRAFKRVYGIAPSEFRGSSR